MKFIIQKKAYLKMKYFIDGCEDEISGWGKVKKSKEENEDVFTIYDVEILKQTVTGASAVMSEETMAKFLYEKTKKNQSTEDYRVWWHSHATLESFFSVTDDTTIEQSIEFPYLISIVSNHKHNMKARIDIFQPVRMTQAIDIEIEDLEDEELKEWCAKEITRKVKKAVTVGYQYSNENLYGKKAVKKKYDPYDIYDDYDPSDPYDMNPYPYRGKPCTADSVNDRLKKKEEEDNSEEDKPWYERYPYNQYDKDNEE